MFKISLIQHSKILGVIYTLFASNVYADVFVNLSKIDEISIANTTIEENYSFKIEEPILEITPLNLTAKSKTSTLNNRKLPYNNEVVIAANETKIDPALIHALITVESKYNPHALSIKGAYGLMQLMPETSRRFNVLDKNNPKQNILAGAKYLRELLNLFNGNLELSLAAYNAGPAAVKKYGSKIPPFSETINYVPKVLKYYRLYS